MERKQDNIRKERSRIDTVQWTESEDRAPIDDETPTIDRYPRSEMKASYDVDLLIPLQAFDTDPRDEELRLSPSQLRFVNFYGGLKLAADDLSREGIALNIRVHDTEYEEEALRDIYFNGELRKTDLIIGPYKRESVKWLADRVRTTRTTMVSPWISSTSMTEENPFYIQSKPGLVQHYKTMLQHAIDDHPESEVYLVVREDDDIKERYFDFVSEIMELDPEIESYSVLRLGTDTLTYGVASFDSTFFDKPDCNMVFMVPYSSGRDATFVYDFLRRVQTDGDNCDCHVYGMYRWLDFQDQMFELMNAMPVYLTVSNLVDPFNEKVRQFKRRYFEKFGQYPTEDAYEGYDLLMYLGRSLDLSGTYFQFSSQERSPYIGLQTVFDIQAEKDRSGYEINYFENQFIDLIRIDEYKYKRVE